ncbi:hypothetical protein E2562_020539 [Oryza meyeriana var. granulata]|uniref:Protein kinase domain-containing protein n=1 Tax=Oryza meyeriana var. granulata TaxID=110450 RepID=A0A6G1EB89_9ORYZ|nr:hypothetical protein E2562_020539 [Oryza meyeriana var. granulata]
MQVWPDEGRPKQPKTQGVALHRPWPAAPRGLPAGFTSRLLAGILPRPRRIALPSIPRKASSCSMGKELQDGTMMGVGSIRIQAVEQGYKVMASVAKGLAYLHHECLEWVIHCDVKPKNILLDDNLKPKIADFGLAKLLNRGGSNHNVPRVRGTIGYIAPKWIGSLQIIAKVVVYSYGVVLLELVSGKRVLDLAASANEEVYVVLRKLVKMLANNLQEWC